MAKNVRIGWAIVFSLILVNAGCGSQAPTPPPVPVAPLTDPSTIPPVEVTKDVPPAETVSDEGTAGAGEAASPQPEVFQPAAPLAEQVAFRDGFEDAVGSIHWNRDGAKSFEGLPHRRTVYFFNGMPEGGSLAMQVFENNAANGPDGQPGVLALSWPEIPPKLPYSGFAYLGSRDQSNRLTLSNLKEAKSIDDLRPFRLAFRFQAMHGAEEMPHDVRIGCRLEPLLNEPYAKRLDLGTFTATGEWGSFEKSLAEGTNAEAFLQALADEGPQAFKIVWSQAGSLVNYRAGDGVVLDDIVVVAGAPE